MRPFFLGDSDEQIYGVEHQPESGTSRGVVIVCAPGPEEYMRAHWMLRRLAQALARVGMHVYRFDYRGVGDSAGEYGACTLDSMRSDLVRMAKHAIANSGSERISLVGYRLGANVAIRAGDELKIRDLVLWEPILSGSEYFEGLRAREEVEALRLLYPVEGEALERELLGVPLERSRREELMSYRLADEALPKATRVHLLASEATTFVDAVRIRYEKELRRFEFRMIDEETGESQNLLGGKAIQAMAGIFGGPS